MSLNPLRDLVIVRPDNPESISAGGIILAPSSQEDAKQGTVIAVGPGKLHDNGYLEPMTLKAGDRVAFSSYAKEAFKHKGESLITMHEADVIGVLE
jgi:chaperonin GroES